MNSKLIKALSVVCLALLSIITLELLYATQAQEQLLKTTSVPTTQTLPDEMPTIDLNTQPEESYADLVNRPLFIVGRKPIPKTENAQTEVANGTFSWRLSGVYTSKKGLMALLSRTVARTPDPTGKIPTDNYRKVTVGGDVDDWKVAEIQADNIILTQGATEKKLPLHVPRDKETQEKTSPIPPVTPQPEPEDVPMPQPRNDQ